MCNIGFLRRCFLLFVNIQKYPRVSLNAHLTKYQLSWWSGGATVLGNLPVLGHPTIWITVWQGLTEPAVGAGGGCLDIFSLIYPFSPLSLSL